MLTDIKLTFEDSASLEEFVDAFKHLTIGFSVSEGWAEIMLQDGDDVTEILAEVRQWVLENCS